MSLIGLKFYGFTCEGPAYIGNENYSCYGPSPRYVAKVETGFVDICEKGLKSS